MQIKNLYKYQRENGGITVSPNKPDSDIEYIPMYRVIAEEGKLITLNGEDKYLIIDTYISEGWYEIDNVDNSDKESEE